MNTVFLFKDLTFKEGDTNLFKVQLLQDDTPYSIPANAVTKLVVAKNDALMLNKKVNVIDAEQGIITFSVTDNIGVGIFECEFIVNTAESSITFPDGLPLTMYIVDDLENEEVAIEKDLYDIIVEQIQDVEVETQTIANKQNELETIVNELTNDIQNGLNGVVKEDEFTEALATKADTEHTHELKDVNGLTDEIAKKADKNHKHEEYLTEHQSLEHLALVDHTHDEFNELENEINKKANINHTHTAFATLQEEINKKAPSTHLHTISEVKGLASKLEVLAETEHTHTIDKIEGLQEALDAKLEGEHKHQIADVNNLQEELNKKSNLNHTHAIFTTFRNDIDAKAPKKHTHTMAEVSGLATKLNTLTDADTKLTNDLRATEDTMILFNTNTNNKINTIDNNLKASIADTDKKLTKEIATKVSISSFSNYQAQQQTTDYKQNKEIATLDETLTYLQEEVANIQLSGVTGEIEVLTTEEIETMWKNINDK